MQLRLNKILLTLICANSLNTLAIEKFDPTFKGEVKAAIKLFDHHIKEIERIDGDGLLPRSNRKTSWKQVTHALRKELGKAKTKKDIGHIFRRLDSAYPNLHAHIALHPFYDFQSEGKLILGAYFRPKDIKQDGSVEQYLISSVKPALFVRLEHDDKPRLGDQLIAINGRSIKDWANENFEFCKFPYRSQCENNFIDLFRKETLSWNRRQPLKYKLQRKNKIFEVEIPVTIQEMAANTTNSSEDIGDCSTEDRTYPDFKLVYKGYHACAYESENWADITLLRIRSFVYNHVRGKIKIDEVSKETKAFDKDYWEKKAASRKLLIIDIIDNHGGEAVVDWMALFLDMPFQDQWVQLKNIKEMSDPEFRKNAFYNELGKEKIYKQVPVSSKDLFLANMPQFCVSAEDCLTKKWKPFTPGFKGNVLVLADEWCISSCVGFAWTLKNYLKERVFFAGMPDSGDSTYWRVFLEGTLTNDAQGYSHQILARKVYQKATTKDGAMFSQAISGSRSTDETGKIVSGLPIKTDLFVSAKWNENTNEWIARLIQEVKESIPLFIAE